jgi:hypothetical protein
LDTFKSFESKIYSVNEGSFTDIALELFRFQAIHNPVYKAFIENLRINAANVNRLEQIPFLPITFFKHQRIQTGIWEPEVTFTSSGTTKTRTSSHSIPSLEFYLQHAVKCFESFFGPLRDYHFLALLPSYLERQGSSLIAMMDYFIKKSESGVSGFYLHDIQKLLTDLQLLRNNERKIILWGVSFALLDLAENHQADLSPFMIFETGGMKGRRSEITRGALHETLKKALHVTEIYSEYGMTELMSQAYTKGGNRFITPSWMKVFARDLTDPMQKGLLNESGGINVVDLANYHSVAFIETEDLGRVYEDGSFEVLGRLDNSDIRGCNLLID